MPQVLTSVLLVCNIKDKLKEIKEMAGKKYSVNGKPYKTVIDNYKGAPCSGGCGRTIAANGAAIGVRHGTSFWYYHPSCWAKSQYAKDWPKIK
jgi:hypothetical protein